ncbi:MAG: Hsp70 family protein [Lacunisphaera sp.]
MSAGDNWDEALIGWLVDTFKKENGIDLRKDPMALQRLKERPRRARSPFRPPRPTTSTLPFITGRRLGPEAPQRAAGPVRRWSRSATASSSAASSRSRTVSRIPASAPTRSTNSCSSAA